MNPIDFLYLSLALGWIVLVGFAAYGIYHFVETLKRVRIIMQRIDDTAHDITMVKDGLKLGFLSVISKIIGNTARR